ncbi:MAG TPA: hypothetical protein VE825_09310 [Terriglobales bacterium]|jgi:hypothetical protein|nr:hypothetical protein [Terriglobales bacterium]
MLDDLRETLAQPWRPLSRPALAAWLVFYALFLLYALAQRGEYLFIDNVNLVVHEAGHALFGWFGPTLGLMGGTIFQLLVPLLLAAYFVYMRQTAGAAFCSFFFFENFLGIAIYMADARAQQLTLVSIGGGDEVEHDWFAMLSRVGLLQWDTRLAAGVRVLGWTGMIATVLWLAWRARGAERS